MAAQVAGGRVIWLGALAAAWAADPPPDTLDALARGEVVVVPDTPRTAGAVRFHAWVDVDATPAATWTALVDHAAKERASRTLTGYTLYHHEPLAGGGSRTCIRWQGSRLGLDFAFHHCYDADAAGTRLSHALDEGRANDLVRADGVFLLTPGPRSATTRIHYEAETALPPAVPGFLTSWLGGTSAREFLEDLRLRAGGAP
jgi:hypothetical protein